MTMSPRSFGDMKVTIYLLDEGHAIAPVVPPLKDEDEARDERGGASERHIELEVCNFFGWFQGNFIIFRYLPWGSKLRGTW